MIDHSRTEQMILEMDKLAKEDHSYKASKAEIEFTVAIGGYTQTWHALIQCR